MDRQKFRLPCLSSFLIFSFSFNSPESFFSIHVSIVGACWNNWRLGTCVVSYSDCRLYRVIQLFGTLDLYILSIV